MPAGRPTKYKSEMCEQVVEFMAKGYSKEAVAGKLGIAKDTLYRWVDEKPEFSDAVARGEALALLWWEELGMRGVQGEIPGFVSIVYIFNLKNRRGWKDKQEVSGPGSQSLFANFAQAAKENQEPGRFG